MRDKWTDERLDDGFRHVDARFDQVDSRLDRVDARFDRVDSRLDRVDARFDGLEERMAAGFAELNTRFDSMQRAMFQGAVGLAIGLLGVIVAIVTG